ncbi:clostripain-related cysteine peptidase [Nocardioides sp. P86]|uniref:clostripain-related cysteine peptidase n=1 Tax=Nocardioides sp. P86 TaxID=2939569 RepID=UPI00203C2BB1|nr:clostripain-related cysteine peptidase [Nocardioides sp. P86]MCM3516948.1 clostripain-related cysteine peptidase [Nocardioides sp. P86]
MPTPSRPRAAHRRPVRAAVAAALLVLAAGCGGASSPGEADAGGSVPTAHTGREGDGWTVLHYSMADTDLEPFMVGDLNELGAVGSNDNLQVRELMDRSPDYGADPALDQGDWVGARVLDLGPAGTSELVEDLGDVDSADPATLADFVAEGIEAHRAGHYALVISDHGASWPGVGPDDGTGEVLDLADLTRGISEGLERAGVDKLDLLGFDACLMASYEVASAVAPLADRLVASQELEPGHGWDYGALRLLAEDPDATADQLGAALLDGFVAQAEAEGTADGITLGLVDLTRMDEVDAAMAAFSGALAERAVAVAPVVGRAGAETLGFARSPDEAEDSHMKDLGLLATTIGVEALDVSDEADALVRAIGDAVVSEVDGAATRGATGLSIYFPPTAELADGAYLDVASAEPWADFLTAYYDAGAQIPAEETAQFTDLADGPLVELEDGGVYVTAEYDELGQANLTDATISYAVVEPDGSLTYLGEESAAIDPDGAPVASGFYDLTTLEISDGIDTARAYVSLLVEEDADVVSLDVPMAYYAPGDVDGETYQDVLLSIEIDVDSGDIVAETYYAYDPATEGYGELNAEPDGLIVPEVYTLLNDGSERWTPTSDVGLYADLEALTYDLVPLESGTRLQLDLTVYDYGDNASTISGFTQVP